MANGVQGHVFGIIHLEFFRQNGNGVLEITKLVFDANRKADGGILDQVYFQLELVEYSKISLMFSSMMKEKSIEESEINNCSL